MNNDGRLNFYAATLLTESDLDALDAEARAQGRSRAWVMREALGHYLRRESAGDGSVRTGRECAVTPAPGQLRGHPATTRTSRIAT